MWAKWPDRIDLKTFRSDGDYLSQNASVEDYHATYDYVVAHDGAGYLSGFTEDDLFGVHAVPIDGRLVTRDLLDSVLEMNFLRRHLGPMDGFKVLDIGAGYGRFAHRFTAAIPDSYIYCVDAVAKSTDLCDFYIQFRGFGTRARAVPLAKLGSVEPPIDLAVNIHSWSECPLQWINFWLDRIAELDVTYLFVVPHTADAVSMEPDGRGICFLPAIESRGYKIVTKDYHQCLFAAPYLLFEKES